MNSQFLFEKLESSDVYKKFISENKDAYLCSGFFIIDLEKQDNKYHFDFYVPVSKKTFSFETEDGVKVVELERTDGKVLEKVSMKKVFDFDDLRKKISEEMVEKKISNKIHKMIFSLQSLNNSSFLIGTIFLSGLALLKVNFDISKNKITDFEKSSFFDMMKIVKKKG